MMIEITSFKGPYRWLSNFAPAPIIYNGHLYKDTETAYQAAKTLDPDEQAHVRGSAKPGDAKRAGNAVTLRPDWEAIKLRVMEDVLRLKFQLPEYHARLRSTCDIYLEEGNNWHDLFYGKCYCDKHLGEGENHLGKLLMKIRAELG